MARTEINDLPKDTKVTEAEMKKIMGGCYQKITWTYNQISGGIASGGAPTGRLGLIPRDSKGNRLD